MIALALRFGRALTPTAWLALGVLAAFLIFGAYCAYQGGRGERTATRKAEAGQTFAEGRTAAAQDASAIRDRADARNAEINTTIQEATDEIRHAPDDNAAATAALRGLCRLHPDRDARCRVQQSPSGRVG